MRLYIDKVESMLPDARSISITVKGEDVENGKYHLPHPGIVGHAKADKPISGYGKLSDADVGLINSAKEHQERCLRLYDLLSGLSIYDQRSLATAKTHIESAFSLMVKAIAQPGGTTRIALPGDIQ
jgi:hypothetical protein